MSQGDVLSIGPSSGQPTPLDAVVDLGIQANEANFANNMSDPPTPTGILLDNLPFILAILVGIGGIVGYIALKRRKAHR